MKFKKAAAFIISTATMFSSVGVYSSADSGIYAGDSVISEAYSSSYTMSEGDVKTFTVSLRHNAVSDIRVTCSGRNSDIVTVTSIKSKNSGKKVAVTVKALGEGSVNVRVYNKKTKKSVTFSVDITEGSRRETVTAPVIPSGGGEVLINVREGVPDFDRSGDKSKKNTADDSEASSYVGVGYEKDVLDLVNKERKARGLSALHLDEKLCDAASGRASEITKKFSHTRPDGTTWYTILAEYRVSYYSAAENIAYGYTNAEDVVDGWMNSSGHRANILNEDFNRLGVGYNSKNNSWVQLFAD